jgi:hypothetical protein
MELTLIGEGYEASVLGHLQTIGVRGHFTKGKLFVHESDKEKTVKHLKIYKKAAGKAPALNTWSHTKKTQAIKEEAMELNEEVKYEEQIEHHKVAHGFHVRKAEQMSNKAYASLSKDEHDRHTHMSQYHRDLSDAHREVHTNLETIRRLQAIAPTKLVNEAAVDESEKDELPGYSRDRERANRIKRLVKNKEKRRKDVDESKVAECDDDVSKTGKGKDSVEVNPKMHTADRANTGTSGKQNDK